jgi:hypothetical protein
MGDALLASLQHHRGMLPLVVLAAAGVASLILRFWPVPAGRGLLVRIEDRRVWVVACGIFLAGYLVIVLCNVAYPVYLEHVEPSIASVSYIFLQGAPLYHGLDSTQRYAFPYGPMGFLPFALSLQLMGANVLSLKLVVLLANLLFLWLLWRSYRRIVDPAPALLSCVGVLAYLVMSGDYLLQVRGDILIVLSVALALFAVVRTPTLLSALLFSAAFAFAFDVKITALLYFLPLFVLLVRRQGWRPAVLSAVGAALLALLPFLSERISLARYLQWLRLMSHEPLARVEVMRELPALLLLCAPVGLLLWRMEERSRGAAVSYLRSNRLFMVVLALCVGMVAVSASKIGAGPHHFMPFYAIFGYVCVDIYAETQALTGVAPVSRQRNLTPLLWTWLVIAVLMNGGIAFAPVAVTLLTGRSRAASVAADLQSIMRDHPGKAIEMGYGGWNSQYKLTYYRPALVFAGNPFTIDAMALGDMQLVGITIPASTLEYLQGCRTRIWLVPKGDQPFSMVNVYSLMDPGLFPERRVFSDEFRRIFFERYRKQPSSKYFDIWECNEQS